MKLIKPNKKYEKSWNRALAEFKAEGRVGFWNFTEDPGNVDEYVKRVSDYEKGKNLPKDWVPASTYWLIDNDKFVGHVNIRHKLNDHLKKLGGHIGYAIRPSARKKGYGIKILELGLLKAKKLGLKKALVSCDESNIASKKIIERNGAKFKNKVQGDKEPKLRYWIKL